MPSLYCARCGLRMRLTPASLLLENCPRCMARTGAVAPFVVSPSVSRAVAQAPITESHATLRPSRS